MKKISLILCTLLCIFGLASCKKEPPKHSIEYVLDGGINNPNNPTEFKEGTEVVFLDPTREGYEFIGWFINDEIIKSISKNEKNDVTVTAKWKLEVKPPVYDTKVAISGPSEVRSGESIKLTATVTDADDKTVSWSITSGQEFASIAEDGTLTAKEVDGDKIVEVTATSNFNSEIKTSKHITIISNAVLTEEMLESLKTDKIGYEGYVNVKLYTIGLFEKLHSTYTYMTKTAMDGTNWYTEYEDGNTGVSRGLYFKNHNNLACQVGVSFMNEEQYEPMLDEKGHTVSWNDAGLYNNFQNLQVSDFTYNEKTGRYDYSGNDKNMPSKIIASANPYDFIVTGFSLIIEDGEIIGIYSQSGIDYTIANGYKAIQELVVTINYGDVVEVPTINKFTHDDIHDDLQVAINNMRNLDSYSLNFREITKSYLSSTYTQSGFKETIVNDNCYFDPYTVEYNSDKTEVEVYEDNDSYGYKKISDMLYNTYNQNFDGTYSASRAYEDEFSAAKPSFEFAAEIFTSYYPDPTDGTVTYYVNDVMCSVASTFFYGVGNDINLYGIFATIGRTSDNSTFTPYVVVKDGYIVEAGFYFYMGTIYGVVILTYSDFNTATLPDGVNVEFEKRNVPSSWEELTLIVSEVEGSTGDDIEVNAAEYLKELFKDENILDKMPFFGVPLGDTYGFGITTFHIPFGSDTAKSAINFYYDVPLDLNSTIESSLKKIEQYLLDLGFEKNAYGEFNKGNIWVAPTDTNLDLMIYVWMA